MNLKITEKKEQLLKDGYCVFENVLDAEMLLSLRNISDKLLAEQSTEDKNLYYSSGSNIAVTEHPFFAELIAYPNTLAVLASLGYPDPKFSSGFIISKPPNSPRLFWHYDYAVWDDPDAFRETPQQLFLAYYLVDTTPHNGCLRVIPGSHMHDNPLLTELQEAHTEELTRANNLDGADFSTRPDEVDVTVKAGDLFIGDSRLLHASHANHSNDRRTLVSLIYHPDFQALSEPLQAFISQRMTAQIPEEWPQHAKNLMEPLSTRCEGSSEPLPWNRNRPLRGK